MNHEINWQAISESILYYQDVGYQYTETPWIVPNEISQSTFEGPVATITLDNKNKGDLVGSAEQGFIHLINENKITPGKYVSAGPCFRLSENIDRIHQEYFFKVELVHILNNEEPKPMLEIMTQQAINALTGLSMYPPTIIETDIGLDIEINGIEVGSYGIRTFKNFSWVYGTGIAEPRFSISQDIINE